MPPAHTRSSTTPACFCCGDGVLAWESSRLAGLGVMDSPFWSMVLLSSSGPAPDLWRLIEPLACFSSDRAMNLLVRKKKATQARRLTQRPSCQFMTSKQQQEHMYLDDMVANKVWPRSQGSDVEMSIFGRLVFVGVSTSRRWCQAAGQNLAPLRLGCSTWVNYLNSASGFVDPHGSAARLAGNEGILDISNQ